MIQKKTIIFILIFLVIAIGLVYGLHVDLYANLITRKLGIIKPMTEEVLFRNSDLISYVEVLEVDKKIEKSLNSSNQLTPGTHPNFPTQKAQVKFLKVLKGPTELENTTSKIIKGPGYFYLNEDEKLVLYLEKRLWSYCTVSPWGQEPRLGPALADLHNLRKDKGSGIIVEISDEESLKGLRAHVLRGRHKAPVVLGSEVYKDNLLKTKKINEFDIAEISLIPGSYTILIESEGNLYTFNRLVDGYYPYVILGKSNWRSLDFNIKEIMKKGSVN